MSVGEIVVSILMAITTAVCLAIAKGAKDEGYHLGKAVFLAMAFALFVTNVVFVNVLMNRHAKSQSKETVECPKV